MKLPPEIRFHEEVHLFVWRPSGILNDEAIDKVVACLEDLEARSREPLNRFADTVAADAIELNFKYVIQVSLHRRLAYADRPPVKSAILATDATTIHYGRLHALLTQGSPITVRVFQDRERTAQWLGVPMELLDAEPSGKKNSEADAGSLDANIVTT